MIQSEWIKLIISAFLGGGAASVFNYYARKLLANWKQKEEEKKLAYIYLVKLSYLVAFIRLIKSFVASLIKGKDTTKIESMKNEDLEITHQVSILISTELDKLLQTEDFMKEIEKLDEIESIFKDFIEFKIKEELLAKVSQESILEYQLLTQSLDSIKYGLKMWMETLRKKKPCEAFLVFQTWLVLKKVHDHSEKLFSVLLKKSNILKSEGEKILFSQLKELHESLMAGIIDKNKIEKALKAYQKTVSS